MAAHKIPLQDRLNARLVETPGPLDTPCLIWTGSITTSGYGQIALGRTMIGTHRAAWMLVHGDIPEGHHVHHRCEVRECCNVEHLELMTITDHLAYHGSQLRTTCRRGHALVGDNVHVDYRGDRNCRTCYLARAQRANRRKASRPPHGESSKEVAA